VRGDICPRCCGEEREVSVDCPFDCEYLREARRHDKPNQIAPDDIPNKDIRVTDEFLREHQALLAHASQVLLASAMEAGAVDGDVREALESMIKTHLTLESGLIYESRPNNPYAAAVQQRVLAGIEELRKRVADQTGIHNIRDKDLLGVFVFLRRVELHWNNGRSRSRAFLHFLHENFPPQAPTAEAAGPSIVAP
jgi:hypothetical protein